MKKGPAFRCWLFCLWGGLLINAEAVNRRNILLVIADDLGADSLSLFNTNAAARFPPTPNINALATNGIVLKNVYSYPTCSPTRSSMLTGRYGFRTGLGYAIVPPNDPQLPGGEVTIPEVLSAHSTYRHAAIGKWHMTFSNVSPNSIGGFSHFAGALQGALQDYNSWTKVVDGSATPNYTNYATTDTANEAISWINTQGTNAWFLWLAFNAGHNPLHKPPNQLHSYDALSGTQPSINQNPRAYFEAMIEAMDTELGRVLANISLTNTTVIFLGDNGCTGQTIQPPYSSGRAKGTLYEGGIRVPMIVAGAGVVAPNRTNTNVIAAADVFPTVLELAELNVASVLSNRVVDGHSLLPIINNQTVTNSRIILTENFSDTLSSATNVAGRALRDERYKLIQFRSGTNELYDLQTDYLEATNLLSRSLTANEQTAFGKLLIQSEAWQERPLLRSLTKTPQSIAFSFSPVQRSTYSLEGAGTFGNGDWTTVTSTVAPGSDITIQFSDTATNRSNRFYRVGVIPP